MAGRGGVSASGGIGMGGLRGELHISLLWNVHDDFLLLRIGLSGGGAAGYAGGVALHFGKGSWIALATQRFPYE